METEKDICIVIPSYNRPEDIQRTLSCMIKEKNIPGKIIVVDQSKDNKTEKVVEKFKNKLPVFFRHLNIPSSSIAINTGIKEARKEYKIVIALGDDVDIYNGYLKEILKEFEDPKVMALGGVDMSIKEDKHSISKKIANMFLHFFLLPFNEKNKFRVLSPYGNTSTDKVTEVIRDAEWIPGFNTALRSKIFENYLMPEVKGYNVLEDIDNSYNIFRKYGKGSLVITPKCKVLHRYSQTARYNDKKRIFVNHEDHLIFYYKYFNNFTGTLKYFWNIIGIIIGNSLKALGNPKKDNRQRLQYNLDALFYIFKNRKRIKIGLTREFLNEDLSLKDEYK